jgi:putative membrane protein
MKRSALFCTAVAAGLFAWTAPARAQTPAPPERVTPPAQGTPDMKFLREAAQGGQAEVVFGRLAQQRAASPAVREFGRRMVLDHSAVNRQLTNLASREGVLVPKQLNRKDQELADRLSNLQGAEFDRAYMKHMVKDHEHDLAAFKKEANSGQDAALKEFASKSLPLLEEHLRLAQKTQEGLNLSEGGHK